MQDEKRIEIIERVFRDELTVLRATVTLGADRATVLIKERVHQEGLKAVIHANRGPGPLPQNQRENDSAASPHGSTETTFARENSKSTIF
jgi:hypothetical protein